MSDNSASQDDGRVFGQWWSGIGQWWSGIQQCELRQQDLVWLLKILAISSVQELALTVHFSRAGWSLHASFTVQLHLLFSSFGEFGVKILVHFSHAGWSLHASFTVQLHLLFSSFGEFGVKILVHFSHAGWSLHASFTVQLHLLFSSFGELGWKSCSTCTQILHPKASTHKDWHKCCCFIFLIFQANTKNHVKPPVGGY